jgi:hypothetical protein
VDPDERELVKIGAEVLTEPATDFLKKVSGTPGQEIGETFGEYLRFRRWKRAVKMLKKAEKFAEKKGLDPKQVPDRTLFPILDGASLEDDDDMTERWAHLLASAAADPEAVPPSFATILSGLSPQEAHLLDFVFVQTFSAADRDAKPWTDILISAPKVKELLSLDESRYEVMAENLFRLNLLAPRVVRLGFLDGENQNAKFQLDGSEMVRLTSYGKAFIAAVRED